MPIMVPAIPSILVPYFSLSPPGSLTLITSVLDASSTWLMLRHVYAILSGIDDSSLGSSTIRESRNGEEDLTSNRVLFISFLRPLSLWVEMGKKLGLNLSNHIATKRFVYVDEFNSNASNQQMPGHEPNSFPKTLRDLENAISQARGGSSPSLGDLTIIIDNIDFLLASQADASCLQLSQFLLGLRNPTNRMIIGCSGDAALLQTTTSSATPLEREHLAFLTTIAHQSFIVTQLRSLDTGAAKDVSGVMRISRGGTVEDAEDDQDRLQGEWLYQVKGDGSIRVWSRGE